MSILIVIVAVIAGLGAGGALAAHLLRQQRATSGELLQRLVTTNQAVLSVNAPPPPPPPPNGLGAALDAPDSPWSTSGDAKWTAETQISHDGVSAAQSGPIGDSQSSSLETTVTGPATVSFWWKVDSEPNFDFLTVTVDGVPPFVGISGNVDWQQKTIALTAGPHTIRWTYAKDVSVSVGRNAAWLDQIAIAPG